MKTFSRYGRDIKLVWKDMRIDDDEDILPALVETSSSSGKMWTSRTHRRRRRRSPAPVETSSSSGKMWTSRTTKTFSSSSRDVKLVREELERQREQQHQRHQQCAIAPHTLHKPKRNLTQTETQHYTNGNATLHERKQGDTQSGCIQSVYISRRVELC